MARKLQFVSDTLDRVTDMGVTLPARFKANKLFWTMAEDSYFYLKGFTDAQADIDTLLEQFVSVETKHANWLVDAMASSYLSRRLSHKVIQFLSEKSRLSASTILILACAQQDKGQNDTAAETLKLIPKQEQKGLMALQTALKLNDFQAVMKTKFVPLFNMLASQLMADYRQWLIDNLPAT